MKHFYAILFISISFSAGAQAWTQKADIGYVIPNGPSPRAAATVFVVGDHAYLTTGRALNGNVRKESWRYDQAADLWEPVAEFAGSGRHEAVSFVIEGTAYVFGGSTNTWDALYFNDLWAYDPVADVWSEKAPLPGEGRAGAVAFSLNGKGYVTSGGNTALLQDFWEYDPVLDTWSEMAAPPFQPRMDAVAFAIGEKAYVATGSADQASLNDLWEYDPQSQVWTERVPFPGPARSAAVAFVLNGYAYLGTGVSVTDMWRYDPLTDAWTSTSTFAEMEVGPNGGGRSNAVSFSLGGFAYIASGESTSSYYSFMSGSWKYDPVAQEWTAVRNFGGMPRSHAISVVAPGKIIVGGGNNGDYFHWLPIPWQYIPEEDSWLQKPGTGATARVSGVGFVVDSICYGLTGSIPDYFGEGMYAFNQYAYDPHVDTSAFIAEFAGIDRSGAVAFTIGGKGFLTCGYTGGIWVPTWLNDLWQYDPALDTWTQRSPVPAQGRVSSTGFVLDEKFYLVGGALEFEQSTLNEVWMYDPLTDSWMERSPIPLSGPYPTMVGTAVGDKGYVCAGNTMWRYDPLLDIWQQLTEPPIPFNSSSVAFTVGEKAYFAGGNIPGEGVHQRFYEYSPADDQITTRIGVPQRDDLRIWPNPINGRSFWIGLDGSFRPEMVNIFSIDGRQVFSIAVGSQNSEQFELTLPEYIATGTYLVRLLSGDDIREQKLVVLR